MIAERELSRIIDAVADTNIWIVLDLCYEQLIYDPVPHNLPALLAVSGVVITILWQQLYGFDNGMINRILAAVGISKRYG